MPLLPAIGMLSMMLVAGCARSEFVILEPVDREFVSEGQTLTVPTDGVFLSDRAFKHYSKGCP